MSEPANDQPTPGSKPLSVMVAEALGCKPILRSREWECTCKPRSYEHPHAGHSMHECHDGSGLGCDTRVLASYDEDWAATGPLLEKLIKEYRASIAYAERDDPEERWSVLAVVANTSGETVQALFGPTLLVAVCRFIVSMGLLKRGEVGTRAR